jgi:hypothetical protein
MIEHDFEPVRGLPQLLPANEELLWQGSPSWRVLARRAFHIPHLAGYFGVLLIWALIYAVMHGSPLGMAALRVVAPAAVIIAAAAGFAWAMSRTTVYTITSRRVVIRFGLALPMTVNVPFTMIVAAGLRGYADGTGDLPLTVTDPSRVAWPLMWPHVRPWRFTRSEPMLRGVPEAARVAQTLARALAAHAGTAVPSMPEAAAEAGPRRATALA